MVKLAVIQVRGRAKLVHHVIQTMDLLHLKKNQNCTVLEDTPQNRGMIKHIEPFVTWGEITDATLKKLEGRERTLKRGTMQRFMLAPPVKGWERGGVKKWFKVGGAAGYRGDEINALIEKMIPKATTKSIGKKTQTKEVKSRKTPTK